MKSVFVVIVLYFMSSSLLAVEERIVDRASVLNSENKVRYIYWRAVGDGQTYSIVLPSRYRETGEPHPVMFVCKPADQLDNQRKKNIELGKILPIAGDQVSIADTLNMVLIRYDFGLPIGSEQKHEKFQKIVQHAAKTLNVHPYLRYTFESHGGGEGADAYHLALDKHHGISGTYVVNNRAGWTGYPEGVGVVHQFGSFGDKGFEAYESWHPQLRENNNNFYFDNSPLAERHLSLENGITWLFMNNLIHHPKTTDEERVFYLNEMTETFANLGNPKKAYMYARAVLELPGFYKSPLAQPFIDIWNAELARFSASEDIIYMNRSYLAYSPLNEKNKDFVKEQKAWLKEAKKAASKNKDLKFAYKTIDAYIKLWAAGQKLELNGITEAKKTAKIVAGLEKIGAASDIAGSRAAKRYGHRLKHIRF